MKDSIFGISVKGVKLVRTVEVYQWKESCETDDNDNKHCTYEKVWDSNLIDSSSFEEGNHYNPSSKLYEDEVYLAYNVRAGAYVLPDELVSQLACDKNKNNVELNNEYNKSIDTIKVDGNYLTNVNDNVPEIGDIRISYQYIDSGNVSVLAVQTGNTFEAYTTKNGKDIYKILKGNYTGVQILEKMTKTNKTWKWILRLIGVLMVIGAFNTMFTFINNIASKIPVLGGIITGATGLISFILGLAISLIVIAIAWLRFRPILSIILIIIVVALIVFLKLYVKKNPKEDK